MLVIGDAEALQDLAGPGLEAVAVEAQHDVFELPVAHVVEDEELGLRPEVRRVADARTVQVRHGLPRDVPRVAGVVLHGHRVADVADQKDGFGNAGDSDRDGILDLVEGTGDTDGDGLANFGEFSRGTDPQDPDSDDDTLSVDFGERPQLVTLRQGARGQRMRGRDRIAGWL